MKKILSTKDGAHIFYQVIGTGKPLFFIHGNSGSHMSFQKQIACFKDSYQLILMDTRDHGSSKRNKKELSFDLIASDVLEILRLEGIQQAAFIGFSDGANIALTFADAYPESVSELILISPNLTFDQLKQSQKLVSSGLHFISKSMLRLKKASRVARLAMRDVPLSANFANRLNMPILLILAQWDIIKHDSFQSFVQDLPHVTMSIVPLSGHSIPLLRPHYLNDLIQQFLLEHTR